MRIYIFGGIEWAINQNLLLYLQNTLCQHKIYGITLISIFINYDISLLHANRTDGNFNRPLVRFARANIDCNRRAQIRSPQRKRGELVTSGHIHTSLSSGHTDVDGWMDGRLARVPYEKPAFAPYFFTFHTSKALWEVRKHGTREGPVRPSCTK